MKQYKYIIVGGGMAADAAARAIRKNDSEGSLAIFNDEEHLPYKRPPLTKKLWDTSKIDSIWLQTEQKDIELLAGKKIIQLNIVDKTVLDHENNSYSFDKLLLATGGSSKKLPFDPDGIIYYRSLSDYIKLRKLVEEKEKFIILGGGFIGSELSASLAKQQKEIMLIFPENGIGATIFPESLSQFLTAYYRERGVNVLTGHLAKSLQPVQNRWRLSTETDTFDADQIIAGIGITPNTYLAEKAGLKTDDGIIVNEYLLTSHPDIHAAGDVARMYNSTLKMSIRYEHEDNAYKMGTTAGQNMSGKSIRYDDYLPYFYSDLFDLGYEAVGILDSRLQTIEDWGEKYKKGVIYYLNHGKIVGVLLWNVWGKLNDAREVIQKSQEHGTSTQKLLRTIQVE